MRSGQSIRRAQGRRRKVTHLFTKHPLRVSACRLRYGSHLLSVNERVGRRRTLSPCCPCKRLGSVTWKRKREEAGRWRLRRNIAPPRHEEAKLPQLSSPSETRSQNVNRFKGQKMENCFRAECNLKYFLFLQHFDDSRSGGHLWNVSPCEGVKSTRQTRRGCDSMTKPG